MASKRPCEQQPGVIDEMANAIVHQVKAQRIVVNKGPMEPYHYSGYSALLLRLYGSDIVRWAA